MGRHKQIMRDFDRWGFDACGWRPKTRRHYHWTVGKADRWLHAESRACVLRASTRHLHGFLSSLSPHPPTRNRARHALVGFYRYLCWRGTRTANPAVGLPRLREPRAVPKALSATEAAAVLAAARAHHPMWNVCVCLMLYAGLRNGEARGMQWGDVGDDGWLTVHGKGGVVRRVPVHPHLAAVLAAWRPTDSRWVLPSPQRWDAPVCDVTVWSHVSQIGEAAGLDALHPHVLRHTYATGLVDAGVDVRKVQELLGHVQLSSTQVYLRVRPSGLVDAVGRLRFDH